MIPKTICNYKYVNAMALMSMKYVLNITLFETYTFQLFKKDDGKKM